MQGCLVLISPGGILEQRLQAEFRVWLLTDTIIAYSVSFLSLKADENLHYEGMGSGNGHHAFFVV